MHSKYKSKAVRCAVTVLGLAAIWGCSKKDEASAGAPAAPPPPAVTVAEATSADVPVYLDEIGKISAIESVTITPRIDGQIIGRYFEDGADLKKGQKLFSIDPRPSDAALLSAKAQLAEAKAAQDFAKIELDRYAAVAGTKAISKSDYDTKKNAMDVATAQVSAADAAVTTAQVNVDYCTIASPLDGRASSRMVDVGNVVKQNETAMLSIQKIDPIYADFTVNEDQLASVRENMANGTLKAYIKLVGDTGDGREGNLTFLDNSVQDATGTIRLRATVPNQDRHFWPGQFCNVRLILKVIKDAVLIPSTATQVSQQGLFVFRVDSSDKSPTKLSATQQTVTLGQQQGSMVVVEKGLSAGDKVVTNGQMLLQPGSAVMVVGPGAPGAPGMAPPTTAPSGDKPQKGAAAASANITDRNGRKL